MKDVAFLLAFAGVLALALIASQANLPRHNTTASGTDPLSSAPMPALAHFARAIPLAHAIPLSPAAPAAPATCGHGWTTFICPNGGSYDENLFQGVATVATNDVWAVGAYEVDANRDTQAIIEHWDGAQWNIVPSPVISNSYLYAVTALSPSNVWAVGDVGAHGNPYGITLSLTEHWDGSSWQRVSSPNYPNSSDDSLYAVDVISANDIWAFGEWLLQGNEDHSTLTMHWDGTQWSIVPSPNATNGYETGLFAGAAIASNDVWAIGEYWCMCGPNDTFTMHWDGTQWTIVSSPSPGTEQNFLYGATALASDDVWAVGYWVNGGNNSNPQALVEHWDGNGWQVVPSANMPGLGNELEAAREIAPNDIWAVGYTANPNIIDYELLAEHWDGVQWSIVSLPPLDGGGALGGVAGIGSNDVWAVGLTYSYPE